MKRNKKQMVQVEARRNADLQNLPTVHGVIVKNIAKKVLDGNGIALVPIEDIQLAIDTQDGVNTILDNFDLTDPDTQYPLLWVLINNNRG